MNTNEMAEQASQTAKETAQNVTDTARNWGERAKSKAREAGAAADYYVHEYTWTTVVTTAVVAGLIGYLLGRRDR